MQVYVLSEGLFPRIFLLWLLIIVFMLLVQLLLTSILFLLENLWRWWFLGKCLSSRFEKYLPIFVDTFLLKGVLSQIMFLLWLRLW